MLTGLEATTKANLLLVNMTIEDLAKSLGITKPTLYARLREHTWKLGEISLLEKLK